MYNKTLIESITNIISGNYIFLDEALAASAHKGLATKAANSSRDSSGLTAGERISKDVMPTDRITIPLDRSVTPNKMVVNHLSDNGYSISDYTAGLAAHKTTPTRHIKIGKILGNLNAPEHIKKAFEKDPARQGIKGPSASIVITRRPSDVAAMSTHQNWESCQTLGGKAIKDGQPHEQAKGMYSEMVPGIVKAGTHMAYLVQHPDDVDKHYKPIARISLNPYRSAQSKHTILRPSTEYGDAWEGFHSSVQKWAEKNFPTKDPQYTRHQDAYPEGDHHITNYGPEHNEFWKTQHHSQEALEHNPNPDVLHHYTNTLISPENKNSAAIRYLAKNKNIPSGDMERLVNHVSHLDQKTHYYADHVKIGMAPEVPKPEHIEKLLDSNMGSPKLYAAAARNENATPELLHRILDTHGASPIHNSGGMTRMESIHSEDVIKNVIRNKNSNDSHYQKILNLDEFHSKNPDSQKIAAITYNDMTQAIAQKPHSEDTGRKLVRLAKLEYETNAHTVDYIGEQHPHLLKDFSDSAIRETFRRKPLARHIENELLSRGPGENDNNHIALARNTYDRNLLGAFKDHANPMVRVEANNRRFLLDEFDKAK